MNETKKDIMENKRILKIVVPVLLILVVAGIWVLKNAQDSAADTGGNPDFAFNITEEIDLDHLKSYALPILLNFGADSCPPCREMAPALQKLNRELQGKAIIRYIDVWKYPALAENYPVSVLPTQILIDAQGNPYVPKEQVNMRIILYSTRDTDEHVFTAHEGGLTEAQMRKFLQEMGME